MSILNKFNKGKMFDYDNTVEREFISFKELVNEHGIGKVYPIQAIFINDKSKFGDAPVLISNEFMVNAPQHLLETAKEMIADDNLVDMVNQGKVGFELYAYKGKNGNGISCNWVEL